MITFNNTDNFKAWLDANIKGDHYDFDAVMSDVFTQQAAVGCEGRCYYELAGWETKSGNPELYFYDYEFKLDEHGCIIEEVFTF